MRQVVAGAVPGHEPRRLFAKLVDLSLVQRLRVTGEPLFRVLPPIKDVAVEVLGDANEPAKQAHAGYFFGRVCFLESDGYEVSGAMEFIHTHDADLIDALEWAWEESQETVTPALGALLNAWLSLGGLDDRVEQWLNRATALAYSARRSSRRPASDNGAADALPRRVPAG